MGDSGLRGLKGFQRVKRFRVWARAYGSRVPTRLFTVRMLCFEESGLNDRSSLGEPRSEHKCLSSGVLG